MGLPSGGRDTTNMKRSEKQILKPENMHGPNFMSSYNQWYLKHGILKISRFPLGEPGEQKETESLLPRRQHKTTPQRYHRSRSLKNTWNMWEGELFAYFREYPGETEIIGRLLQEQRSWQVPFPSPAPRHKHTAPAKNSMKTTLAT